MQTVNYLDGKKEREIILPSVPPLMSHQIEDAKRLVENKRFCLFNEPGTGKTLTALHAWLSLGMVIPHKMVIVVPPVAITNWVEWTLAYWYKYRPNTVLSVQVLRTAKCQVDYESDVLIFSYGIASSKKANITKQLYAFKPEVIVLDECHYLATHDANRTQSIYGGPDSDGLVHLAEYIWPMTGTPIRRYADDLWPLLSSVFPDVAKKYGVKKRYAFLAKFCKTQRVKVGPRVVEKTCGSKNLKELNEIFFGENMIAENRRLEETTMPSITFDKVDISYSSTKEFDKLTERASKIRVDAQTGDIELSADLAKCWSMLGMFKARDVSEFLKTILENEKGGILCLFWHKEVGEFLRIIFSENSRKIDGSTSAELRQQYIEEFNEGKVRVLFGQIAAMGVAINLQKGGRHVVFAERSWSPSDNLQAYRRVWRLGQTYPVRVHTCITDHLVDALQTKVLTRKIEGIEEVTKKDGTNG